MPFGFACARGKLIAYHNPLIWLDFETIRLMYMRVTLVSVPNVHVCLNHAYGSEVYSPSFVCKPSEFQLLPVVMLAYLAFENNRNLIPISKR